MFKQTSVVCLKSALQKREHRSAFAVVCGIMRRHWALSVIALMVFSVACFALAAQQPSYAATTVPQTMNFQGRLADGANVPKADGLYNMTFRLYAASSGGSALWTEVRETTNRVQVTNGLFTVQIGSVTPIPASLFAGGSLYFEAELPTPATATCATASCASYSLGPFSTRSQVGTSAYAFNADAIDGIDGGALARNNTMNTFVGAQTVQTTDENALTVTNGTAALFTADTLNSQVKIGTADTTAAVLVLDTKTDAGDPTGTVGAMYYNANAGKMRCYQGAAWSDCVTTTPTVTLQTAYDSSTSPATITTAAGKGVAIATNAAPATTTFTVDASTHPTTTNDANAIGVKYAGGSAAVEGSAMRIDYASGDTSGGTWNGMRIVAAANGAASGVNGNGIKLEGPTVPGTGMETALNVGTGWDIGLDLNSGGIRMSADIDPTASIPANELQVYAKSVAGRMLLKAKAPSGITYSYQPSLFQQNVVLITPGNGTTATTYTTVGGSIAAVGTLGTITAAQLTQSIGSMSNITTAATANSGAGPQTTNAQFFRGSGGTNADGFFYATRVNFSGNAGMTLAKYTTTPGARFFAGLSSLTINNTASMTAADNPTGSYAGFQYSYVRDTNGNFQFITKDGTTQNVIDTGVPLAINKTYDFYVYCAPGGTTVYWKIENLTDGTATEGSTGTNLPAATTAMRAGVALASSSTTTIQYRFQRLYAESDR